MRVQGRVISHSISHRRYVNMALHQQSGKRLARRAVVRRTSKNREFRETVDATLKARGLLRSLTERRKELQLSQTIVAARMRTSQSALARLEAGDVDPKMSTVERYALAMGEELVHRRSRRGRS